MKNVMLKNGEHKIGSPFFNLRRLMSKEKSNKVKNSFRNTPAIIVNEYYSGIQPLKDKLLNLMIKKIRNDEMEQKTAGLVSDKIV